jgi:hypothetical protein
MPRKERSLRVLFNVNLVAPRVTGHDRPRLSRSKIGVTRLSFRCAVFIPDPVDFFQGSRSGVRRAAIRSHFKQFPTQFDCRNRHDVVANDPRDKNTPDPPQPKDEFVLKFVKR